MAILHARQCCELAEWKHGHCLDALAAAYAEAGDFQAAVEWEKKAVGMSMSDAEKQERSDRLVLFQSGKPYRCEPANCGVKP